MSRGFQRRGGTDISGRSIEIPAILSPSELSRALDRKEIPSRNSQTLSMHRAVLAASSPSSLEW